MKKNLHGETRKTRGRIQELLLSKQFKTSGQKSKVVETEKCQYLIQQVSWGLILGLISTKLLITSLLPLFAWCPARPVPGNQWYRELTYQVSLWTSCHGVTNERWLFAKMWLKSMRAILDPLCVWTRIPQIPRNNPFYQSRKSNEPNGRRLEKPICWPIRNMDGLKPSIVYRWLKIQYILMRIQGIGRFEGNANMTCRSHEPHESWALPSCAAETDDGSQSDLNVVTLIFLVSCSPSKQRAQIGSVYKQ